MIAQLPTGYGKKTEKKISPSISIYKLITVLFKYDDNIFRDK